MNQEARAGSNAAKGATKGKTGRSSKSSKGKGSPPPPPSAGHGPGAADSLGPEEENRLLAEATHLRTKIVPALASLLRSCGPITDGPTDDDFDAEGDDSNGSNGPNGSNGAPQRRGKHMYVSHGAQLCAILHEAGVNICLMPALLAALPEAEVSIRHLCQAEMLARTAKHTLRCTYRTMLTAHARARAMTTDGGHVPPNSPRILGGAERVGSPMEVMSDSDDTSDEEEEGTGREGGRAEDGGSESEDGGSDDEADALEWSAQSMSPGD